MLGHNVVGEPYAPQSDPLQFLKQRPAIPATQIYQRVKHTMRSEAIEREKRRIQALNDRERERKEQLLAAAQRSGELALSPEDALEAKLDRLLLAHDNNNSERHRTKDRSASDAEETEDDNNQQQQQLAA